MKMQFFVKAAMISQITKATKLKSIHLMVVGFVTAEILIYGIKKVSVSSTVAQDLNLLLKFQIK
jgi:uncharacterized protein YwlG (UPF0340 family)